MFKLGIIEAQMKGKTAFYFYGNWKTINGYIGEPQKTLQRLINYLKKRNTSVEMLGSVGEVKKIKNGDYKVLIFGDLPTICIRTLLCLIWGIGFEKIHFILFKGKMAFSDITDYFRNIDSFTRIKYLNNISILEAFLPRRLYVYLARFYKDKIFAAFFPTNIVDKSKIFLCSCLEENYLQNIVFSNNKNFNKKDIRLLYFGRDSYLRGVDVIQELNGIHKGYNFSCTGIFPFKGYLSQAGLNSQYHIYDNDKNILKRVRRATFSIFPFRVKLAGPDVPAALIESILLGVPPIISKILMFDILYMHNYPLVIDRISSDSVKKCIEDNVKSRENYQKIINLCRLISRDIIKKYSYNFSKINV